MHAEESRTDVTELDTTVSQTRAFQSAGCSHSIFFAGRKSLVYGVRPAPGVGTWQRPTGVVSMGPAKEVMDWRGVAV